MKLVGTVLFLGGFLAASLISVREANTISWVHYGLAVGVSVLGVVLRWLATRTEQSDQEAAARSLREAADRLREVLERVRAVGAKQDELGVYGVHVEIDAHVMEPVNAFVEVRESIVGARGLDVYARTMDAFAAGERALNRAWSASADGYIDEVRVCLARAERNVARAVEVLEGAG